MVMLKRGVRVALLLGIAIGAYTTSGPWKRFRSSTGFSVTYPSTWFKVEVSPNRLDLFSSRGVQKGVLIKKGEACIIVIEMQGPPQETLHRLITEDQRGAVILSHSEIRNKAAGERGCHELREVVSREAAVPREDIPGSVRVPYRIYTAFYCEVKGRKFSTSVLNWDGDKRQAQYQHIALEIAKSLRVLQ